MRYGRCTGHSPRLAVSISRLRVALSVDGILAKTWSDIIRMLPLADALVNQLANEKATAEFCELPFHYQQIATILLTGCVVRDHDARRAASAILDATRG